MMKMKTIKLSIAVLALMLGLLVCAPAALAQAPFAFTAPTAGTNWCIGSHMPIQWTGGDPNWNVNLSLIDVPNWVVYATIVPSMPNTGAFTWTIPSNIPPSTYQIYVQNLPVTSWAYGPSFSILKNCCVQPPPSMISWWPSDGNALDIWDSNHGTLMNGAAFAPGKVAQAFSFDGVNDYVKVPDSSSLNFGVGSGFSIDAWIKTRKQDFQSIIDKREAPGNQNTRGYHLYLYKGLLGFQMADASAPSPTCSNNPLTSSCTNWVSQSQLADGQWHHVAVTVLRGSITGGTLYVDGMPVLIFDPTVRIKSLANKADLLIAKHQFSTSANYFSGNIDEIEIFNRAITAAHVQSIYNAGSAGKCKKVAEVDPMETLKEIINVIQDMADEGTLNNGQGNSLNSKLENAIDKINEGNLNAACNQLNAFINQVNAFISGGICLIDDGDNVCMRAAKAVKEVMDVYDKMTI
ncbi:MAG: LamG-like jellyroll fold domain-containing protein [Parcubacteria group bacterium]